MDQNSDARADLGITLDIQQLHTTTKGSFAKELESIPTDCLRGIHVHAKHNVPSCIDTIPWEQVSVKIAKAQGALLINLEVIIKEW